MPVIDPVFDTNKVSSGYPFGLFTDASRMTRRALGVGLGVGLGLGDGDGDGLGDGLALGLGLGLELGLGPGLELGPGLGLGAEEGEMIVATTWTRSAPPVTTAPPAASKAASAMRTAVSVWMAAGSALNLDQGLGF